MQASRKSMLMLLQTALWGTEIDVSYLPSSDEGWKKLFDACDDHAILETIIPAIFSISNTDYKPSNNQVKYLKEVYLESLRQTNAQLKQIAALCDLMESEGCQPVLLKGQGNARWYACPQYRRRGDIDLYVNEEKYQKAFEILWSKASPEERAGAHEHGEHIGIIIQGEEVELHRHVGSTYGSECVTNRMLALEQYWLVDSRCEKMQIGGSIVRVPCVFYNVVFLFMHAWKHFITYGLGLRQLVDIVLLLHKHHSEIDDESLRVELDAMQLLPMWRYLSAVLVEHLGLPSSECPLYQKGYSSYGNTLWNLILDNGNFGNLSKAEEHHSSRLHRTWHYYIYRYRIDKLQMGRGPALRLLVHDFCLYQFNRCMKKK